MKNNKLLQAVTVGMMVVIALALVAVAPVRADSDDGERYYVPMISGGRASPSNTCEVSNTRYEALSVSGSALNVDPERNADLNLGYRGYAPTNAPLTLVTYGPVTDRSAPQFPAMFADNRVPAFTATYQRFRWDESCDCPVDTYSPWPATVVGMKTQKNEAIAAPDSGYDIGGGKEYMVLYAGDTGITLHVGRTDGLDGYVVHIEGICVEPDLLALYRRLHADGRGELPALRARQALGRALDTEIAVAIRDNGHFLDPRSRNDWWQGR